MGTTTNTVTALSLDLSLNNVGFCFCKYIVSRETQTLFFEKDVSVCFSPIAVGQASFGHINYSKSNYMNYNHLARSRANLMYVKDLISHFKPEFLIIELAVGQRKYNDFINIFDEYARALYKEAMRDIKSENFDEIKKRSIEEFVIPFVKNTDAAQHSFGACVGITAALSDLPVLTLNPRDGKESAGIDKKTKNKEALISIADKLYPQIGFKKHFDGKLKTEENEHCADALHLAKSIIDIKQRRDTAFNYFLKPAINNTLRPMTGYARVKVEDTIYRN